MHKHSIFYIAILFFSYEPGHSSGNINTRVCCSAPAVLIINSQNIFIYWNNNESIFKINEYFHLNLKHEEMYGHLFRVNNIIYYYKFIYKKKKIHFSNIHIIRKIIH